VIPVTSRESWDVTLPRPGILLCLFLIKLGHLELIADAKCMREGFLNIRRRNARLSECTVDSWTPSPDGAEVELDLKTNYVQGMYAEGKN
jgi:hypothetical protein